MLDFRDKVEELEHWTDGKGLILRGANNTFCSGSDLRAVKAISNPEVSEWHFRLIISSLPITYMGVVESKGNECAACPYL